MDVIESEAGAGASGRSIWRSIRWPMVFLCCWLNCHCALRPIPRDLALYVNHDIYAIAELENSGLQRYGALTGNNYISDAALRHALDMEIIPAYTRFATLVCQIEPQTEPVQKLHALYRKAVNFRLQGFRVVLLAIDTQDPDLMRQANGMLDQGQHFITQWRTLLAQMAGQYGMERD